MLRFGTAGLRAPIGDGPDRMNVGTVTRATAGLAAWLTAHGSGGGTVVVGRDARHGSADFARAAAEVLAAAGFRVVALPRPLPTPVTAFAVRHLDAVAGVQVTASHNPPGDNGYKVYLAGGAQIVPPIDRAIEESIAATAAATPDVTAVPRVPVAAADGGLPEEYLARVARLPRAGLGDRAGVRVALTPLHGVGGETAVEALRRAGFTDIHVVEEQFAPDPDFPTVAFPNPEEPGACDLLLDLAARVRADVAIALDPDADRCAVGVPCDGPAEERASWRMLRGDETGPLLAEHVIAGLDPRERGDAVVATTLVSSALLPELARARGVRCAVTSTGFKWLVRGAEESGGRLVYAYEEAIGHCVDPDAVADKDGISAAVVACDLVAGLAALGRGVRDALDASAAEFGVHAGTQIVRWPDVGAADIRSVAAAMTEAVLSSPPEFLGGIPVYPELLADGSGFRLEGRLPEGISVRASGRPSGTEPKVKFYIEVIVPVGARGSADDIAGARRRAAVLLTDAAADLSVLT